MTTVATATLRPCVRQCGGLLQDVVVDKLVLMPLSLSCSHRDSIRPIPSRAAPPRAALSTAARSARLARLCTGRKSSTCGIIARAPCDLGS